MKKLVLSLGMMFLISCGPPSVKTVVKRPAPCQISVFPKIPRDVVVEACTIDGAEYICFKPEEIWKIANWSQQIERWSNEVAKCPWVRQYTYENQMYNIMKSMH